RVHGTTRRVPLEVFEAEEKSALIPLQAARFDTPTWALCKVHPDHHVRFAQALYSLPTRWIGCQVDVRGDRSMVRIYVRNELIKTHERKPPGGRSTDYTDYPDGEAPGTQLLSTLDTAKYVSFESTNFACIPAPRL